MIKRGPRQEQLQRELERIINKINYSDIQKIILFGSLAKGRIGLASDIDLIIIKDTKQRFLDRLEGVYKEIEPNMAVDVLVYTPEEIEEMRQWNGFIKMALSEGRILYERKPQERS